MVQKKLCSDANDALRIQKQRKVGLEWYEFPCFESSTAFFASQHQFYSVPCDRVVHRACCVSTLNHLLYVVRFCAGSTLKIANRNIQRTSQGFLTISFYNYAKRKHNKKFFLPLREEFGIQWSYLSERKEKQLVRVEAKIRQRTLMIILSKPPLVSLI